jgi:putative ABC transport system permease protein
MLTISLRNLWEHKLRSFLLGGAIVTGVAFVVAAFVFTDSLRAGFTSVFQSAFAAVDIQVTPIQPEDLNEFNFELPTIPEDVADELLAIDGVEAVSPQIQGFVILEPLEGELPGFGPPTFGVAWEGGPSAFEVVDGRAPETDLEVLLDAATLEERELAIGDTIRVATAGAFEEYEIVGELGFAFGDIGFGPTFVGLEFERAQELLGMDGEVSNFGVTVVPGEDVDRVNADINAALDGVGEAITSQSAAEQSAEDLQEGLGFFNTFLLIFAGISLVTGSFVVYNAFRVVVAQRTRELGLLRVLGATRAELLRMVLTEAVIVGVVASLIGAVLGIAAAAFIRWVIEFSGVGSLPDSGLVVEFDTLVIGLVVGTTTAALSALIPAFRATGISPMAALRDQVEVKRASRWWLWTGLGLTTASVVAVVLATMQARDTAGAVQGNVDPIQLAGIGALGLFVGLFLLARALARPVIAGLGRPLRRLTSVIARENARRTPRRTATTAASLMIGLGLVATVAILSTSVEDTILEAVEEAFTGDAIVQPTGFNVFSGFSTEVGDRVETLPEVDRVARLTYLPITDASGIPNVAVGIEPDTIDLAINFEDVEGSWSDVVGDGLALQRIEADNTGLGIGDEVTLDIIGAGERTFVVRAIFDIGGGVSDSQSWYINYETVREINDQTTDNSLIVAAAEGVDPDALVEAINAELEDFAGVTATNIAQLIEQIRQPLLALTGMIAGLLFLSVIVAVVGIVLTLYLAVNERTREIGLVRAIGMTRPQVRQMVRWEAILIALYGAVLGLAIGIFLGWGLTVTTIGEGSSLTIPWSWVVAGFFGSGIAGVLASLLPANQAAKLDVLRAIAYE